jgi:hypothetical protein
VPGEKGKRNGELLTVTVTVAERVEKAVGGVTGLGVASGRRKTERYGNRKREDGGVTDVMVSQGKFVFFLEQLWADLVREKLKRFYGKEFSL